MLLMSLLSSAIKAAVLLVLSECGVETRSVDKLPVLLVLFECGVVTRSVDKLPVLLVLSECGVVFCSPDKPVVLLVLLEWLVLLRRGAGLAFGLAFGFAAGLGFVTTGFGLLRVMVLCAAMPMGQSMMSRVKMRCLGGMMCVSSIYYKGERTRRRPRSLLRPSGAQLPRYDKRPSLAKLPQPPPRLTR